MTATVTSRPATPKFTAALRVPRHPHATDHRWPDLWPRRSELELAALDTAPGSARGHARAVLREWETRAGATEDALMVVSELVTNAVTSTLAHGNPGPVRLWLLGDGTSVLILVWDATMPAPVPAPATPGAEHGRGLTLVAGLSARWGWYYQPSSPAGKSSGHSYPQPIRHQRRPDDLTGARAAPAPGLPDHTAS